MQPIYLHTVFDSKDGKPLVTGIRNGEQYKLCQMWRSGTDKTLSQIYNTANIIKRIIESATPERPVILSGFEDYIKHFNVEVRPQPYHVYDWHLPDINTRNMSVEARNAATMHILQHMTDSKPREYQKVLANAAVVYRSMENTGLLLNDLPRVPEWSLKTASGRSKSTGFNVQGLHEPLEIANGSILGKSVLVNFDWISADIRVASLLSGDMRLQEAFAYTDPYTFMMETLQYTNPVSRDECKIALLRAINSMDFSRLGIAYLFPQLYNWVNSCKLTLDNTGILESILGRKFSILRAKNKLAVLNGIMQGSVAHAMQASLHRIWSAFPKSIIAEIHDSLVLATSPELVPALIEAVTPILFRPFEGLLPDNPVFPIKVSIGNKWKQWRTIQIHRVSGVEHVRSVETAAEVMREADAEEDQTAEEIKGTFV